MKQMLIEASILALVVTCVYPLVSSAQAVSAKATDYQIQDADRSYDLNPQFTYKLRQNLSQDIDRLAALESDEFRSVDLKELRARIQNVRVAVANGRPLIGSGYRNGAVNFSSGQLFEQRGAVIGIGI
ncbi:MAG: hypothetical protein EOP06_32365 [Proteobacteria bacterium]|nr:MAG: hypothetical protein EOP06_32365 [Pseudomonadota bacterium]